MLVDYLVVYISPADTDIDARKAEVWQGKYNNVSITKWLHPRLYIYSNGML